MLELETHRFEGTEPEFVLIIAGIHTSEQSGIEVARWIAAKLADRPTPTRLGAIVIPEIFPERAMAARTDEFQKLGMKKWREDEPGTRNLYKGRSKTSAQNQVIFPARQFPPPGKPVAFLDKGLLKDEAGSDLVVKGNKVYLQPEIAYLIHLIEAIKPVRIVSVHGKRRRSKDDLTEAVKEKIIKMSDAEIKSWDGHAINGVNFAGVFVDPRYALASNRKSGESLELSKFSAELDPAFPLQGDPSKKRLDSAISSDGKKDDALCVAVAKAVGDKTLVPGNHLDDPVPVVHYAKEGDTPTGYSLGDWGPVDVPAGRGSTVGARVGAPVFTIEVDENQESWAFADKTRMVTEDGKPLPPAPTPAERANKKTPKASANPSFSAGRSKALQAYAQAVIALLDMPL